LKIIRDVKKARETLLKRTPPEILEGPSWWAERTEDYFGRKMPLGESVACVLDEVRDCGIEGRDKVLLSMERCLDATRAKRLEVKREEIAQARHKVDSELVAALEVAAERIRSFHSKCRRQSWVDFGEGGLGQWIRPLERVGIYVPGGRASYPSTLLMTAIPARVAGVKEIIVTTPPSADGVVSPTTLLAAEIAGADRVFNLGLAHAIAAMTYGSKTVPKVDKVFGPGNIIVQLAKRTVYGTVGIDGFYGPTETVVVADETADPACCAADLLAQAEHDAMASAILITPSERLATAVSLEVDKQVARLGRRSVVSESLKDRGGIVVVPDMVTALSLVNEYAPEHVSLMVNDAWTWAEKVKNAGGVFVGEDSPEVVGDYTAGPSHVMPTGGTAHFSSPVNLDDFLKVTSVVAINRKTLGKIGPAAAAIARAEGLDAHSRAVEVRLAGRRRKKND
jgi:histidinol dehydrogenase